MTIISVCMSSTSFARATAHPLALLQYRKSQAFYTTLSGISMAEEPLSIRGCNREKIFGFEAGPADERAIDMLDV